MIGSFWNPESQMWHEKHDPQKKARTLVSLENLETTDKINDKISMPLKRGSLGANKQMNHQQPINNHDKYEVYRIRMYRCTTNSSRTKRMEY